MSDKQPLLGGGDELLVMISLWKWTNYLPVVAIISSDQGTASDQIIYVHMVYNDFIVQ